MWRLQYQHWRYHQCRKHHFQRHNDTLWIWTTCTRTNTQIWKHAWSNLYTIINSSQEKTIRDNTKITGEASVINFNVPTIDHGNSIDKACHWLNVELLSALGRITPLKQSSTQTHLANLVQQIHQRPKEDSKITTKGMEQVQETSPLDSLYHGEEHKQLTNGISQTTGHHQENTWM